MQLTFQNQLNRQEINRGLAQYIIRKSWHIILLLFIVLFIFSIGMDFNVILSVGISIFGMIAGTIFLFLFSGSRFSPEKTATYRLYTDHIEIAGSGSTHQFSYSEIKIIHDDAVMILCLPKNRCAIVAKRNLTIEQKEFLESCIFS